MSRHKYATKPFVDRARADVMDAEKRLAQLRERLRAAKHAADKLRDGAISAQPFQDALLAFESARDNVRRMSSFLESAEQSRERAWEAVRQAAASYYNQFGLTPHWSRSLPITPDGIGCDEVEMIAHLLGIKFSYLRTEGE